MSAVSGRNPAFRRNMALHPYREGASVLAAGSGQHVVLFRWRRPRLFLGVPCAALRRPQERDGACTASRSGGVLPLTCRRSE